LSITPRMKLRECLDRFPEIKPELEKLIGGCVYCLGFMDEPLENVFKAHRLDPQESLEKLKKFLEERCRKQS